MRYRVRFRRSAEKELAKLDPPVRARVLRHIEALANDPRPPGVTRLVDADDLWRIRIGDYRVVYEIHDDELIVRVIRITHRGVVYRN
ncbi:MAG: type II toxin-antitoxin system RelE family toxin [Pseudonocardiaceae bacterium]